MQPYHNNFFTQEFTLNIYAKRKRMARLRGLRAGDRFNGWRRFSLRCLSVSRFNGFAVSGFHVSMPAAFLATLFLVSRFWVSMAKAVSRFNFVEGFAVLVQEFKGFKSSKFKRFKVQEVQGSRD
jgi:hypothetical protein